MPLMITGNVKWCNPEDDSIALKKKLEHRIFRGVGDQCHIFSWGPKFLVAQLLTMLGMIRSLRHGRLKLGSVRQDPLQNVVNSLLHPFIPPSIPVRVTVTQLEIWAFLWFHVVPQLPVVVIKPALRI